MPTSTIESLAARISQRAVYTGQVPVANILIAEYAVHGVDVSPVSGNCWFGESMVSCPFDGVQYCMDAHGRAERVGQAVEARALVVERHHQLVKQVYDFCVGLDIGDIWVLCSGGWELTAYFGNQSGYLATLHLSHVDPAYEPDEAYLTEQREIDPAAFDTSGTPLHLLRPSWCKHDHLFANKISAPGMYFETSSSIYGANVP